MAEDKRFKDQATELSDMMDHINNNVEQGEQPGVTSVSDSSSTEMDLLNLPPRSHVHTSGNQKNTLKWKLRFPLIRLLFVLFIMIIILALTFNKWWELDWLNSISSSNSNPSTYTHPAGERVQIRPIEEKGESDRHNSLKFNEGIAMDQVDGSEYSGKQNKKPFYYKVKEKDTIQSIAIRFYGGKQAVPLLKEVNKLSGQIKAGQLLLIPNIP